MPWKALHMAGGIARPNGDTVLDSSLPGALGLEQRSGVFGAAFGQLALLCYEFLQPELPDGLRVI